MIKRKHEPKISRMIVFTIIVVLAYLYLTISTFIEILNGV